MNNTKKILIVSISVIVLIACITFVSYGYVYTNTFGNSDIKNTTFISQSLKVLYSDGSESIISDYGSNFVPGTIITKTFTLTNIGNNDISYSIDLKDVTNTFSRKDDIVYEVSENSTVIGSGIFPSSDGSIVLGDDLYKGQSKTYTLTINYLNTEDNQIVDSGATISGNLSFGVRANSLYKLNIYGNSKQLGIPSPSNPVDVVDLGTKTKNLVDWDLLLKNTSISKTNDGYYAKGYAVPVTSVVESLKKVLKPNVNYTISRVYTGERDASNGSIAIRISGEIKIIVGYGAGFKSNTFSLTEEQINNITAVYFYFHQNGATISNIQLEEGSVATEYKPYGYEIPLSLESTKNLFSFNTRSVRDFGGFSNVTKRYFIEDSIYTKVSSNNYHNSGSNNLNYEIISDNSIKLSTTATTNFAYGTSVNFRVLPNTNYTISADYDSSKGMIAVGYYDRNGNYIKNRTSVSTFVTPESCYWINIIFIPTTTNQEVVFNNIQFEKGDKATSYEPYKYTYVKSIYLDEPLRGVGTCDTCSDYIELSTGKVVRNITKQYLNDFSYNIQNVAVAGGIRAGYFSTTLSSITMKKGTALGGLSNVLLANNGEWASMRGENVRFGQNNTALYIYTSSTYATKADLLNYLGNGNSAVPYVVYQLDKPIYEQIDVLDTSEFVGKKVVVCDSSGICASRVEQI